MIRLTSMLFAFVLTVSAGNADDSSSTLDDIRLTIHVRHLLYQDDALRPHNIGVQVKGRVAILFGPVPSLDVGLRAESRLRDLIELRDVRNELDVLSVPSFQTR